MRLFWAILAAGSVCCIYGFPEEDVDEETHSVRFNRQSAYGKGSNQQTAFPGSAQFQNPGWSSGHERREYSDYNPDCPESVEDEELEFGNKEFYAATKVNKFVNCDPAFPKPYIPSQSGGNWGGGNGQYYTSTQRSFQRLNTAPTKGYTNVKETSTYRTSAYFRPGTQAPPLPQPPAGVSPDAYFPPPWRPYFHNTEKPFQYTTTKSFHSAMSKQNEDYVGRPFEPPVASGRPFGPLGYAPTGLPTYGPSKNGPFDPKGEQNGRTESSYISTKRYPYEDAATPKSGSYATSKGYPYEDAATPKSGSHATSKGYSYEDAATPKSGSYATPTGYPYEDSATPKSGSYATPTGEGPYDSPKTDNYDSNPQPGNGLPTKHDGARPSIPSEDYITGGSAPTSQARVHGNSGSPSVSAISKILLIITSLTLISKQIYPI